MTASAEHALVDRIGSFRADPLSHARYVYPWGEGELKSSNGPRRWQAELLDGIGQHLRNPETRFVPLQIAIASGHGVGKSSAIAMVIKWAMDTCVDCKVVVTANTEAQLRTKTWPELHKWNRLSLTRDWFSASATSLTSAGANAATWRADAVTWSENNTEAFQGLHNEGKRIVVVMDEASAIADKVWEVTEGVLTDANTEIIWIVCGNPTRNTGRFRECFRRFRHRWQTKHIDSRQVEGTNKVQMDKWVQDYGEDSDFVKVRVRGVFPSMSARQFINEADVDAAYGKVLQPASYEWAPVILTCDPAWSGDDELVIGKRQGLRFTVLHTQAKNDNDVHVANLLARLAIEHKADAVFVDGGYGTGIVSVGRTLGLEWTLVWFGEKSNDAGCLNKRAEMWNATKVWLKEGGAIPADTVLRDDLLGPEVVPRMDGKLLIEAKDSMKARGLPSPNRADALCLSFAHPVHKDSIHDQVERRSATKKDYDMWVDL